MTETSDRITATAGSTRDATTSKPRRGLFSRFRRRKQVAASNTSVEQMDQSEKEEETERTISEAETTDCVSVVLPTKDDDEEVVLMKEEDKALVPTKQEDEDLVRVETETTASDDPENDSVVSSSSSLVSSCAASSFFSVEASTDEPLGPSYESRPGNYLHKCLRLLSSDDLDLNRLGLQKLNLLVSGRIKLDIYRSEEIAASVLVLGGPMGSVEELLRFVFVTMICDNPQNHFDRTSPTIRESLSDEEEAIENWALDYNTSNSNVLDYIDNDDNNEDESDSEDDSYNDELNYSTHHSRYASYDDDSEESSAPHSQGKAGGALHNHALKILANALGEVYAEDPTILQDIPLDCSLWKSIIMSLVQNIENNHSSKATMYSMKILRFLYFVQPKMILPLLKYILFAKLVELQDFGEEHNLPMISSEAEKLLIHALAKPRTTRQPTQSKGGTSEDNGRYVDL